METNPYRNQSFNEDTTYDINPTGSRLIVTPYTRTKVRDDAILNSRQYKNKFMDDNLRKFNDDPISLEPDVLEKLKDKATERKPKPENVFTEVKVSYVNVDSSQRNMYSVNNYEENIITLPPYPLQFTNGSNLLTILHPQH